MPNIELKTAGKIEVVESLEQVTKPAAEDITAGFSVRLDPTSGKFTAANGTTTTEAKAYGMATRTVKAGLPLTALRRGVVDGFTLSGNFGDDVFLSDTDGRIGTTAGTVSKVVGAVESGFANLLGTTPHKLLRVDYK